VNSSSPAPTSNSPTTRRPDDWQGLPASPGAVTSWGNGQPTPVYVLSANRSTHGHIRDSGTARPYLPAPTVTAQESRTPGKKAGGNQHVPAAVIEKQHRQPHESPAPARGGIRRRRDPRPVAPRSTLGPRTPDAPDACGHRAVRTVDHTRDEDPFDGMPLLTRRIQIRPKHLINQRLTAIGRFSRRPSS